MAVTINGTTGIDTPSLTADTTTLVVDETNNRVGIGTSSPASTLHVSEGSGYTFTAAGGNATSGMQIGNYDGSTYAPISLRGSVIRMDISGSEAARIDSSGNLQFNSGYGSVATAYGCRAWVNFNGTGTVSINEDGNISSITDDGTGRYTLNFSTALPDGNYCANICLRRDNDVNTGAVVGYQGQSHTRSTSAFAFKTTYQDGGSSGIFDPINVFVAIIR